MTVFISRSVLVKQNGAIDRSQLRNKERTLTGNIKINPDLSYQEIVAQSILLKELWQLIQQGTDCKLIKIRYEHIFVQNKILGKVLS